jgi:Icc-related predicted phosphoesterase
MKIQIVSDLHLECLSDNEVLQVLREITRGPKGEVLILAGDICPIWFLARWRRAMEFLCQRYSSVLYVPGNHEHYNLDIQTSKHLLEEASKSFCNLYLSWLGSKKIGKYEFLLSTLWYEYSPDCYIAKQLINDFSYIKRSHPDLFIEEGKKARELVKAKGEFIPIWIFHHLPSPKSISDRYKGSLLNCYFLNDIEDLIGKYQPRLVIHGHTHDYREYLLGDTRVVCNPRGYGEETNPRYNPNLVIEI